MDYSSVTAAYLAILGAIAATCVLGVGISYYFIKEFALDIRKNFSEKTKQELEQSKNKDKAKEDKAQESEKIMTEFEKLPEENRGISKQLENEKKSIKDYEAAASLERQNTDHSNWQQGEKFNNERFY